MSIKQEFEIKKDDGYKIDILAPKRNYEDNDYEYSVEMDEVEGYEFEVNKTVEDNKIEFEVSVKEPQYYAIVGYDDEQGMDTATLYYGFPPSEVTSGQTIYIGFENYDSYPPWRDYYGEYNTEPYCVVIDKTCCGVGKIKNTSNFFVLTSASITRSQCQHIDGIENLCTVDCTNMSYMFACCSNVTSLDLSNLDTSNVTDMTRMFYYCSRLTSLDLSNFDTSNVTDMKYMFQACSGLTSLDLSNLDTSNVTDMTHMFYNCSGLASLDLSNLDTSNVTDMTYMFYNCSGLTSLDLSNLDTSNVTDMTYMFYYCSRLTSLDLSNFDTSNVTIMSYMFYNCSRLVTIYSNGNDFNTEKVTSSGRMFSYCNNLVGGNGTKYSSEHVDASYAHVDTEDNPGYFTLGPGNLEYYSGPVK